MSGLNHHRWLGGRGGWGWGWWWAVVVGLVGGSLEMPGAVWTVTSVRDEGDADGGDGECLAVSESGQRLGCTLRAALELAVRGDTIVFSTSITVIRPRSELPVLRGNLLAPETTPMVLDGSFAGDAHGLRLEGEMASGVKVSNLVVVDFARAGILVAGRAVSGMPREVVIEGCSIGVVPGSSVSRGNGVGIQVVAAEDILIRDNVVVNSAGGGIEVMSSVETGDYTRRVRILGNLVGVNRNLDSMGNTDGVVLGGSPSAFLPGLNVAECALGSFDALEDVNFIQGNRRFGVVVQGDNFSGPTVPGNEVQANFIAGNGWGGAGGGIRLDTCDRTTVWGNQITENLGSGILVTSTGNNRATDNRIEGNDIFWNLGSGVRMEAGSQRNLVGGEEAGNRIFSNDEGVVVVGSTTTRNTILGNEIHGNLGLGIDLGRDGVSHGTTLTLGTGPNASQPAPEFLSIVRSQGVTRVRARIRSNLNPPWKVEVYDNAECHSGGYGEGKEFLVERVVEFAERNDFGVEIPGEWVALTLTSTDSAGNTSEFSTCGLPFVVNSTDDEGDVDWGDGVASAGGTLADGRLRVTLRSAIEQANALPGHQTVLFDIPGSGPHFVRPGRALPDVEEALAVDATSQPGFQPGRPQVELDGAGLHPNPLSGLTLKGGASAIRGLAIVGFPKDGLVLAGRGGHVIQGNLIGLRADGRTAAGMNESGIRVSGSASNLIGGWTVAALNVVSANGVAGTGGANVLIEGAGSRSNRIQGNHLGLVVGGGAAPAVPTPADGVRLQDGAASNLVGGPTAGMGNVISGNVLGIRIVDAGSVSNRIEGNTIGLSADRRLAVPNRQHGILVSGTVGTRIGGPTATIGAPPGNVISGNVESGVRLDAEGTVVQGNVVGTNPVGDQGLGNGGSGLLVWGADNRLGGVAVTSRNLVSGNGASGLALMGSGARSNQVVGNWIGIHPRGNAALPNRLHGIHVRGGSLNRLGLPEPGGGNLISGNLGAGIRLESTSDALADQAARNEIIANRVGLDAAGWGKVGNGVGLQISGAPESKVGDGSPLGKNVVSANTGSGVVVGPGSEGSEVKGNWIGLAADGLAILGNGGHGIQVTGTGRVELGSVPDAGNVVAGNGHGGLGHGVIVESEPGIVAMQGAHRVMGNWIGFNAVGQPGPNRGDGLRIQGLADNQVGPGNRIGHNQGAGVAIVEGLFPSRGNRVLGNSIHSNRQLGLDLGGDGPTANDSGDGDDGPNGLLNHPVVVAHGPPAAVMVLEARAAPGMSLRLEWFTNGLADASGHGEGEVFLDARELVADAEGMVRWYGPLPSLMPGACLSATVTDLITGDTSEFSPCVVPTLGSLMDFGDAPLPGLRTLLADDGARHVLDPGVFLGLLVDGEEDARVEAKNAAGDDHNGLADEDGVEVPNPWNPLAGEAWTVSASASGYLQAWVDLDGDGDWSEPTEQVLKDLALQKGEHRVTVQVRGGFREGTTYARFRFSTVPGLHQHGLAPDGEVEDYRVELTHGTFPWLESWGIEGGQIRLVIGVREGGTYQVEATSRLGSSSWLPVGEPVEANAGTVTLRLPVTNEGEGYYRVVQTER